MTLDTVKTVNFNIYLGYYNLITISYNNFKIVVMVLIRVPTTVIKPKI